MVFLLVLLAFSGAWIIYMQREQDQLRKALHRYENLVSPEQFLEQLNTDINIKQRDFASLTNDYDHLMSKYDRMLSQEQVEAQLNSELQLKRSKLARLDQQLSQLETHIQQLQQQVSDLEEEAYIQEFGFYQPKYNFIASGDYAIQLKRNRDQQKGMIRDREAAICQTPLTLNGNEKEGKKLTGNFLKLVLTIFNSECDTIIDKVKPSSINVSESKIRKTFDDLNKKSQVINCEITEAYRDLKFRELHLKYELECMRQEEREQEKEIRDRMKQEEKDRRKLEEETRKIQEAEQRQRQYQQQLDTALKQQESVAEKERKQLEAQIEQLRQNLAEAISDKEDAISRSAMIKSGYIYVISNIGSLGRDIYRICMTKRSSNEDEYVRSMTPEVPFPFDVHFKFISEDASETLRQLHERFDAQRVNRANSRREFFSVSIDEIAQAIEEIKRKTGALKNVQYEKAPQALEYRRTLAATRKDSQTVGTQNANSDHETA